LLVQIAGAAVVAAFAVIMTWMIMKVVDLMVGVRVTLREEELGLDLTQHGESGYEL
jgi:Amt family ammonium transporter